MDSSFLRGPLASSMELVFFQGEGVMSDADPAPWLSVICVGEARVSISHLLTLTPFTFPAVLSKRDAFGAGLFQPDKMSLLFKVFRTFSLNVIFNIVKSTILLVLFWAF